MTLVAPGSVVDTTGDASWTPLRVVAHLVEPIVTDDDPLHLDGPLSWCAFLEHTAGGGCLPPMTPDVAVDFDLGLATWTADPSAPIADERWTASDGRSAWGWACSAGLAPVVGRGEAHTRRPVPIRELSRYTTTRSTHTGAGPYKARNVAHATVTCPTVTWWCLGDPNRVRNLLGGLRGLGRLTRHGHGAVGRVEVGVDETARERWRWRQVPEAGGVTVGGIRAPYHHRTRRMPVTPLADPEWG